MKKALASSRFFSVALTFTRKNTTEDSYWTFNLVLERVTACHYHAAVQLNKFILMEQQYVNKVSYLILSYLISDSTITQHTFNFIAFLER